MSIPILRKEDVMNREDDPINMEIGLNRSIVEDDKRIEEEESLKERAKNNGGSKNGIREKIIDFIKSQEYLYASCEQEFDDETNDIFAKDDVLIEIAITSGVDREVIKQIMEEGNNVDVKTRK